MVKLLRENHMTRIAVSRKNFSVVAHVLSVVATETAGRVKMPDIVGVVFPRYVHFRKKIPAVYSFNALNRGVNTNLHCAGSLRIPLYVLFAYKDPDAVHCPVLRPVRLF